MPISGTFLVVIIASVLKLLLSANQSVQSPTVPAYEQYSKVLPFEDDEDDDDDVTNIFLNFRLPQLLEGTKDMDLGIKRQFDPWGGKRQSKSSVKDENVGRKRQFSPWGGKRSSLRSSQFQEDNPMDADVQLPDLYFAGSKRNFNSWGGKRNFNSWGGKRSFNPKSGKRFNAWGGKKNFNAWGGKRSKNDLDKNMDFVSFDPKTNVVMGSKRQAFNSWGGKRTFNSWGGKRDFSSWGGKRGTESEQEPKELNISEDNSLPQTFKNSVETAE